MRYYTIILITLLTLSLFGITQFCSDEPETTTDPTATSSTETIVTSSETSTSSSSEIIIGAVPQWARSVETGTEASELFRVTVGADGYVYAAGYMDGSGDYTFGNDQNAAGDDSGHNVLAVRYDADGACSWARTVTEAPNESVYKDIAVDSEGRIFAAGYITTRSEYTFSEVKLSGVDDDMNMALVKYGPDALPDWGVTPITGPSDSYINTVAIGPNDEVYVAGVIYGYQEYDLGNGITVDGGCSACSNGFVASFDADGNALWANSVQNVTDESEFKNMAVASDGSIYIVGTITGMDSFNFAVGVSVSGVYDGVHGNALLIKYNSNGTAQWARSAQTGDKQTAFDSVAVGDDGSIYTVGWIYGMSTFEFGTEASITGSINAYQGILVKYDSDGNAVWAKLPEQGSDYVTFTSLDVRDDGSLYVVGYIQGEHTVKFWDDIFLDGTHTEKTMFILKMDNVGTVKWAKSIKTMPNSCMFNDVHVTDSGALYTVGTLYSNDPFGLQNSLSVTGGALDRNNLFLIKYQD